MKILIIGCDGYIGSRLATYLSDGYSVSGIDLKTGHDYRVLPESFFNRHEAIIWVAGHSSVKACDDDPFGAISNNFCGLVDLASRLKGQPLIYASSSSVYSENRGNIYDFTKAAVDEAMRLTYANHYALRFGTVCGYSSMMRFDTMLNAMVHSALTKGIIEMRNPRVRRPLLGIEDLCAAVAAILEDDIPMGPQNLCSMNTTVAEVADMVSTMTGSPIKVLSTTPAYDFTMKPSPWFTPRETLATMINSLVRHHNEL